MAITIRRGNDADLETIVMRRLDFLRAVRESSDELSRDFIEKTSGFIETEHRAGRLNTWIAEDGPEVVGVVSLLLWPRPPQPEDERTTEAYIINMYVPSAHRRQGIGGQLLARCLGSAPEFGIREFLLHPTEEARALYESAGCSRKTNWMELPIPR